MRQSCPRGGVFPESIGNFAESIVYELHFCYLAGNQRDALAYRVGQSLGAFMSRESVLGALLVTASMTGTVIATGFCCGIDISAPTWGQGIGGFCTGPVGTYCETGTTVKGPGLGWVIPEKALCYHVVMNGASFMVADCAAIPLGGKRFGPPMPGEKCCYIIGDGYLITTSFNPSSNFISRCIGVCPPPQQQ